MGVQVLQQEIAIPSLLAPKATSMSSSSKSGQDVHEEFQTAVAREKALLDMESRPGLSARIMMICLWLKMSSHMAWHKRDQCKMNLI